MGMKNPFEKHSAEAEPCEQHNYNRLVGAASLEDNLSQEEKRSMLWLAGMDGRTVQNLCSVLTKAHRSGPQSESILEKLDAYRQQVSQGTTGKQHRRKDPARKVTDAVACYTPP